MDTLWYFAYDVTVNPDHLRRIIGQWTTVTRASVKGYSLGFTTFVPSWGGGTADIVEREGGVVYGVAYAIDERQLDSLDKFQGVPSLYRRVHVNAETGSGQIEAVSYTAVRKRSHIPPTDSYLSLIVKGLKHHGYPENIILAVRKMAGR